MEAESVRGLWHPAKVRAVRGGKALVHFDGYDIRRAARGARCAQCLAATLCLPFAPRASLLQPLGTEGASGRHTETARL